MREINRFYILIAIEAAVIIIAFVFANIGWIIAFVGGEGVIMIASAIADNPNEVEQQWFDRMGFGGVDDEGD